MNHNRKDSGRVMWGAHLLIAVVLWRYGSGSPGIDEAFIQHTAVNAVLLEVSTPENPTPLQCAYLCLSEDVKCAGFQLDNATNTCFLYEKICFARDAPTRYHGRKDALEPAINTQLARGKPASMSTTLLPASYGNDGKYGDAPGQATFLTKYSDASPWWRVDLLDSFCVAAVYFMNIGYEQDFIWQRARNIVVTVSLLEEDIMDTADNRCGHLAGVAQQFHNLVQCDKPLLGRFVQLQMMEQDALHFYEVEVHGH